MNISIKGLDIRSLISSKFSRTLPNPSGPFEVGFCDVEYQSSTPIDSPLSNHGNISLRLFYPSSSKIEPSPLKRPLWIVDPRYLSGYLNFVGVPEGFGAPLASALVGQIRLPCVENGSLAAEQAAPNLPTSSLPVMLFSHGLGGMRTSYSYVCYEFASYGFIVASLEHLDGTACVAYTHGGSQKLPYKHSNSFMNSHRYDQLHHRASEMNKAYEFISALQNTTDCLNIYDVERSTFAPLEQHSRQSALRTTLEQFKDRLDLSALFLCGHSFGAMTVIETAYQTRKKKGKADSGMQVKAVLAFDPWMAPAGEHLFNEPLSRPTLVINSHSFHDKTSIKKLHRLFRSEIESSPRFAKSESKIITILNTAHHAHTDLPLILSPQVRHLPGVSTLFGSLDPKLALELITRASREFMRPYLPTPWKTAIADQPKIFQGEPNHRPKEVIIGTSLARAS